jgi:hypothetical protein
MASTLPASRSSIGGSALSVSRKHDGKFNGLESYMVLCLKGCRVVEADLLISPVE